MPPPMDDIMTILLVHILHFLYLKTSTVQPCFTTCLFRYLFVHCCHPGKLNRAIPRALLLLILSQLVVWLLDLHPDSV